MLTDLAVVHLASFSLRMVLKIVSKGVFYFYFLSPTTVTFERLLLFVAHHPKDAVKCFLVSLRSVG